MVYDTYNANDYFLDSNGILRQVLGKYSEISSHVYAKDDFNRHSKLLITKVKLFSDNKLNRKLYNDRIIMVENNKIVVSV